MVQEETQSVSSSARRIPDRDLGQAMIPARRRTRAMLPKRSFFPADERWVEVVCFIGNLPANCAKRTEKAKPGCAGGRMDQTLKRK
jgi:hypothetical protein